MVIPPTPESSPVLEIAGAGNCLNVSDVISIVGIIITTLL